MQKIEDGGDKFEMMSKKIRMLFTKEGSSTTEYAKKKGFSPQNFYKKLKRDNFSEEELREIAEDFGYELQIYFVSSNGERI